MASKQENGDVSLAYSYTKNAWVDLDSPALSRLARYVLSCLYGFIRNDRRHPGAPQKVRARRVPAQEAILDYLEVFLPPFYNWYSSRDENPEDPVHLHRNSRSMELTNQFDKVFPRELQILIAKGTLRSIVSEGSELEVLAVMRGTHLKPPLFLYSEWLLTLKEIAEKDREAVPLRYQALRDALLEENAAEAQAGQSAEAAAQEEELRKAQRLLSKAGWTVYPPA